MQPPNLQLLHEKSLAPTHPTPRDPRNEKHQSRADICTICTCETRAACNTSTCSLPNTFIGFYCSLVPSFFDTFAKTDVLPTQMEIYKYIHVRMYVLRLGTRPETISVPGFFVMELVSIICIICNHSAATPPPEEEMRAACCWCIKGPGTCN